MHASMYPKKNCQYCQKNITAPNIRKHERYCKMNTSNEEAAQPKQFLSAINSINFNAQTNSETLSHDSLEI